MAEESDLERTEPASARRLEQAREEGNVPQSRELMAFMVMAAGAGTFWILGGWIAQRAADLVRHGLSFSRTAAFDPVPKARSWAPTVTMGGARGQPMAPGHQAALDAERWLAGKGIH